MTQSPSLGTGLEAHLHPCKAEDVDNATKGCYANFKVEKVPSTLHSPTDNAFAAYDDIMEGIEDCQAAWVSDHTKSPGQSKPKAILKPKSQKVKAAITRARFDHTSGSKVITAPTVQPLSPTNAHKGKSIPQHTNLFLIYHQSTNVLRETPSLPNPPSMPFKAVSPFPSPSQPH